MEVSLAETADHSIFVAEGRGDTLIVTPRGERAGFSEVDFSVELKRIQSLLEGPRFDNIIIDLSQANYFGSEMIGVINGLLDQARRNGGRGGVCDVSPDMMEGLKIMNLDNYWPIYNSRTHAVNDIVNESVAQLTSRYALRKFGAVAVGVVALGLIAWFGAGVVGSLTPEPGEDLLWRLDDIRNEAVDAFRYNDRSAWSGLSEDLNRRLKLVSKEIDDAPLPVFRTDALDGYAVRLRMLLQSRVPTEDQFAAVARAQRQAVAVFQGGPPPAPRPAPIAPEEPEADEETDGEQAEGDAPEPAEGGEDAAAADESEPAEKSA